MVSVCLPSDALLQHLPSYLGFSYLGREVSLHDCSSKAQPLLHTLDEGYLFTLAFLDLQRGIAPLSPPVPAQPQLLGLLLPAAAPGLGLGWLLGSPPLTSDTGCLLPATAVLGRRVAPLGHSCAVAAWHSRPLPLTSDVG